MDHSHRLVIAASLALMFAGAAQATDPAPKPDAKAEADKSAAAAGKELPSRPFPKVLPPPRSAAKADNSTADKPDAVLAKPAADKPDAATEKPADKLAANQPRPARKPRPKVVAPVPADPALKAVVQDIVQTDAHGQAGDRAPYIVQPRDTLDRVIKKTLPTSPFSPQILREAFMKANPQVFPGGRVQRLRAGQRLRIPDAAVFRLIVLGETSPPSSAQAASGQGDAHGAGGHGPVLNPTALPDSPKTAGPLAVPAAIPNPPAMMPRASGGAGNASDLQALAIPRKPVDVASAAAPVSAVSPEEKKKWVRFP